MNRSISQVSRQLQVSTRTLRYYEEVGLIRSRREPGYAYRVYDEDTLLRLQRIVFLRRMRIPLKSIGVLLDCADAQSALQVLQARMAELSGEIGAQRRALELLGRLERMVRAGAVRWDDLPADAALPALPPEQKEERNMTKIPSPGLTDVSILTLPSMTVAAAQYVGEDCELHAQRMIRDFIAQSGLAARKPDARVFGFNNPGPTQAQPVYGYEYQVTIPDDLPVPAPFQKKRMNGGLYAAHTIRMGDFHEWQDLIRWAECSREYRPDYAPDSEAFMGGLLEEHLNFVLAWPDEEHQQLDLLLPVCKREGK